MPFTLAHPAVVVPLYKRKHMFCFTALVLGSMAPDFEYFIYFAPHGLIGHSWSGFLYFNLPLVFLCSYVYHGIVKRMLIPHLPEPISTWYRTHAVQTWGIHSLHSFIIFVYSALLGMATHVAWDAFTHVQGYAVTRIPLLAASIEIGYWHIPFYKLAQHGSTLIGGICVIVWAYRLRDKGQNLAPIVSVSVKLKFWLLIAIVALVILGLSSYLRGGISVYAYGVWIVTMMSSVTSAIIIVSCGYVIAHSRTES
ncbi:DUF4184 family protein [Paenibacillus sp. ACRRX]|uniref:DUF4184 family protein n=1 Tax=Paenibacillus sp. ACRRX TaxID=2918206 RepID=UPI001EF59361|nr:DUF4184 family protein [Paenibacillus sp. ACRRX]MCG7407243.1 DUF4184 family protein [Paenibacillus sp. ACRRX]